MLNLFCYYLICIRFCRSFIISIHSLCCIISYLTSTLSCAFILHPLPSFLSLSIIFFANINQTISAQSTATVSLNDLKNWQAFFDAAGGTSWRLCTDSRDTPCSSSCSYTSITTTNTPRIVCKLSSTNSNELIISEIMLNNNRVFGYFDDNALSKLQQLSILDVSNNILLRLYPDETCIQLSRCFYQDQSNPLTCNFAGTTLVNYQPCPTLPPTSQPLFSEDLEAYQVIYDRLDGKNWRYCKLSRDDPCGECSPLITDGVRYVKCEEVEGLLRITEIRLRNNLLFGIFPTVRLTGKLKKLNIFDLSNNHPDDWDANQLFNKKCISLPRCYALLECDFRNTGASLCNPTAFPTSSPIPGSITAVPTIPSSSPTLGSRSPTSITATPTLPSPKPTPRTRQPTLTTTAPAFPTSAPVLTSSPTFRPTTVFPSPLPTALPTLAPTTRSPTPYPLSQTLAPTTEPSEIPTSTPTTRSPTNFPLFPTQLPSVHPSSEPTRNPITSSPTLFPTPFPISQTFQPSSDPTILPTRNPTTRFPTPFPFLQTNVPSRSPSAEPTQEPTRNPITAAPTRFPTMFPSSTPTRLPTALPSLSPTPPLSTQQPTRFPTPFPTAETLSPSETPTIQPTMTPTVRTITSSPTLFPTSFPTSQSQLPTPRPTQQPSSLPTQKPTTARPTLFPTNFPSSGPTKEPTHEPTRLPTRKPITQRPTTFPTLFPSSSPSGQPTNEPTMRPSSLSPTSFPTQFPVTLSTSLPTLSPTPRTASSQSPTPFPIPQPTIPTANPTSQPVEGNPTLSPTTRFPTSFPTKSPSAQPTNEPTMRPTPRSPSSAPSSRSPTTQSPTSFPVSEPTLPTAHPTSQPTPNPTKLPSTRSPATRIPTKRPSPQPVFVESFPTQNPSLTPTTLSPSSSTNSPTTLSPTTIQTTSPTTLSPSSPTSSPVPVSQTDLTAWRQIYDSLGGSSGKWVDCGSSQARENPCTACPTSSSAVSGNGISCSLQTTSSLNFANDEANDNSSTRRGRMLQTSTLRIQSIVLRQNGLSGTIPTSSFENLSALKKLDMSNISPTMNNANALQAPTPGQCITISSCVSNSAVCSLADTGVTLCTASPTVNPTLRSPTTQSPTTRSPSVPSPISPSITRSPSLSPTKKPTTLSPTTANPTSKSPTSSPTKNPTSPTSSPTSTPILATTSPTTAPIAPTAQSGLSGGAIFGVIVGVFVLLLWLCLCCFCIFYPTEARRSNNKFRERIGLSPLPSNDPKPPMPISTSRTLSTSKTPALSAYKTPLLVTVDVPEDTLRSTKKKKVIYRGNQSLAITSKQVNEFEDHIAHARKGELDELLTELGLESHSKKFKERNINLDDLLHADDEAELTRRLRDMGLNMGERAKLKHSIELIKRDESAKRKEFPVLSSDPEENARHGLEIESKSTKRVKFDANLNKIMSKVTEKTNALGNKKVENMHDFLSEIRMEKYENVFTKSGVTFQQLCEDAEQDETNPPSIINKERPSKLHQRLCDIRLPIGGRSVIESAIRLYVLKQKKIGLTPSPSQGEVSTNISDQLRIDISPGVQNDDGDDNTYNNRKNRLSNMDDGSNNAHDIGNESMLVPARLNFSMKDDEDIDVDNQEENADSKDQKEQVNNDSKSESNELSPFKGYDMNDGANDINPRDDNEV